MTHVEVKDGFLAFSDNGRGEPLVFVHGSASDYRTWRLQEGPFSSEFRTIVYSRRYHWPNHKIPEGCEYSMDKQVDDLRELLHVVDAEPAHLVGHSYGAFICLLLALREPHLVRSLTLSEPPVITLFVSSVPKPSEILKLSVTRPRAAAAIVSFGAKGVMPASQAFREGDLDRGMRIFGDAVFGSGGFDRLSDFRKTQVRDNLENIRAEMLGPGFPPLTAARVRRIQTPTLLVTGQHSIGLFRHLVDRLEELLPHVERVEIPGATHLVHEDNPTVYNEEVLDHLIRHRDRI